MFFAGLAFFCLIVAAPILTVDDGIFLNRWKIGNTTIVKTEKEISKLSNKENHTKLSE